MGPLPKPQFEHPLLPLSEAGKYDEEPCEAALAKLDEELRKEFEGQEFEPDTW